MSGEVSYVSRFFLKFVEIIAAGLASAISAYLLAHFGGTLLSSSTPASAPVTPTASLLADSIRAQPIPPISAAPVNERALPRKDTDASAAQLAPNGGKETKTLPLRKHARTNTSAAEKEPRAQKSIEILTHAALANIEANQAASGDAPIGSGFSDTRIEGNQLRQGSAPPRQPEVGPRPINVPPRAAAINAAQPATDAEPEPLQLRPVATGVNLQSRSPDFRVTAGLLPASAPSQPSLVDQEKDVFSALKRLPDLLRPEPPVVTGEAPRPPMPVGTAAPEREFGH